MPSMTTPTHPQTNLMWFLPVGIMSATLAVRTRRKPNAWENAGHAAHCELNYTPQHGDGSIDIRPCRSTPSAIFPANSGPVW
jgi:hypothetical protein